MQILSILYSPFPRRPLLSVVGLFLVSVGYYGQLSFLQSTGLVHFPSSTHTYRKRVDIGDFWRVRCQPVQRKNEHKPPNRALNVCAGRKKKKKLNQPDDNQRNTTTTKGRRTD